MNTKGNDEAADHVLNDERRALLEQLEDWLETPLLVLGFVWLAMFVYELVWGDGPALNTANTIIWIIFLGDFALKFTLAPDKSDYLKNNWLTVIALVVPALRVFRIFRVVRVLRAARGIDMPYPHTVVLFHDTTGTREGDIAQGTYLAAHDGSKTLRMS